MKWFRSLLVSLLFLGSFQQVHATNTHGLPDVAKEQAAWFGDAFSPYSASGCNPTVPSSSLTLGAFACKGYVDGSAGEFIYVDQAAHAVGPLSSASGTDWIALYKDTSTAVGGWTRQAGTHYLIQRNPTQPTAPSGGRLFAKVTVAGGIISAVEVIGTLSPIIAPLTTVGNVPAANFVNKGQLLFQTDGVRGLKVSSGFAIHPVGNFTANARDWGLVPTLTDTTTVNANLGALQTAVNAVINAGGGTLYIPEGHYFFGSGTVTVDNGSNVSIFIVGAGPYATKLGKLTTATGHMITMENNGPPSGFFNLGFVAQTGGAPGAGILAHGNGMFFDNLWFNGYLHGIALSNSFDVWISNVMVEHTSSTGYVLDGAAISCTNCEGYNNFVGFNILNSIPSGIISGTNLTNCRVVVPRGKGIVIDSTTNVDIIGFEAWTDFTFGVPTTGIEINDSTHVNIIGGSLTNFDTYGIKFNTGASSHINISGVAIRDIGTTTTGTGISLNSSAVDVQILGNNIDDVRLNAIETVNGSLIRIANNTMTNWGRENAAANNSGVLLSGDSSVKGAAVHDNYFIIDSRPSINFVAGSVGDYFTLRDNIEIRSGGGQLYTLTNAPAATGRPVIFKNSASGVLDFGTPGAVPGGVTVTLAVPGAAPGDQAYCGAPTNPGVNYIFSCGVVSANLVQLQYTQITGAAADPDAGGGTYTATVTRYAY